MAAPQQKNILRINLLHSQLDKPQLLGTLLKWVITSGKFLVIFVELIVVGAFIYRYSLDTQLEEIQDKINNQVPYIKSLKNDETLIRQTQFQLLTITQNKSDNPDWIKIVQSISKDTTSYTKITSITLDRTANYPNTQIIIAGVSVSNAELSAFLRTLQKDTLFSDMTLSNLSFDKQAITFMISGKLAENKGKQT
jgi:hypothetical protein